jgi:hypothetical protein
MRNIMGDLNANTALTCRLNAYELSTVEEYDENNIINNENVNMNVSKKKLLERLLYII